MAAHGQSIRDGMLVKMTSELEALRDELFEELQECIIRDKTRRCSRCAHNDEDYASRSSHGGAMPPWKGYLDIDSSEEEFDIDKRQAPSLLGGISCTEEVTDLQPGSKRITMDGGPENAQLPRSTGSTKTFSTATQSAVMRSDREHQVTERVDMVRSLACVTTC